MSEEKDLNVKAWEHCSSEYVKKNNAMYQNKQIALVKLLALAAGITVNNAYVDDNGEVQMDFDLDLYENTHHKAFMERVELIMNAQTALELVEVATFLRSEMP